MSTRLHWLYRCHSYVDVIKQQQRSHSQERGYQSKLAEAAGCQPSYFSQALSGKVMLTPDHVAGLAAYWDFPVLETEFFLTLLALERAGGKAIKRHLARKLDQLRDQGGSQDRQNLAVSNVADNHQYYSHWMYTAIHIAVSIPALQNPRRISHHLNLPSQTVDRILTDLQNMGLVRQTESGAWRITEKNLHLASDSPFHAMHHLTWRLRAQDSFAQNQKKNGLYYTAVHSMSKHDFLQIRSLLNEAIEKTRSIIQESPEEELVSFNCDFYRLG